MLFSRTRLGNPEDSSVLELCSPLSFQIKRSSIRKGMVMVSPRLNPQASWEFEAEILVLHHPTTISPRYQAMGRCPRSCQPQRFCVSTLPKELLNPSLASGKTGLYPV